MREAKDADVANVRMIQIFLSAVVIEEEVDKVVEVLEAIENNVTVTILN